MGAHTLEKVLSIEIGGYACEIRALSIGEYESLKERALSYITAEDKEEIILSCLISPDILINDIKNGDIEFGIPLTIYDYILEYSGFTLDDNQYFSLLEDARAYVSTDIIESCKVMILAAGTLNREEINKLTMGELIKELVTAEQILFIQQQNLLAAISGGQELKLSFETKDPREIEVEKMHQEKAAEVQELLEMQTNSKLGRGMRRM